MSSVNWGAIQGCKERLVHTPSSPTTSSPSTSFPTISAPSSSPPPPTSRRSASSSAKAWPHDRRHQLVRLDARLIPLPRSGAPPPSHPNTTFHMTLLLHRWHAAMPSFSLRQRSAAQPSPARAVQAPSLLSGETSSATEPSTQSRSTPVKPPWPAKHQVARKSHAFPLCVSVWRVGCMMLHFKANEIPSCM